MMNGISDFAMMLQYFQLDKADMYYYECMVTCFFRKVISIYSLLTGMHKRMVLHYNLWRNIVSMNFNHATIL